MQISNSSKIGLIAASLITFTSSATSATVISDGVELRSPLTSEVPGSYQLTVIQALNRDFTSMWFKAVDDKVHKRTTLEMTTHNLDESADFYLVTNGAQFSSAAIQANEFTLWDRSLIYSGTPPTIQVGRPLSDFYLGINTGVASSPDDWSQTRSVYGWAHFQNTASGIVLLESKMAYGASGITIGSSNAIPAVPEVDSRVMALLGLVLPAALVRLQKRRKNAGSQSQA